ncbi:MAG TPA: DUF3592 domain-containing protein [Rhizomicrobium sp.]|nr:DUF3592 domain-containing protein [Rhizomicrobium sp.]
MPKSPRSIRDYLGVLVIGALIFSILLAITGFIASYDGRRKLAAFAQEGQTVTGTVVKKHADGLSRNWLDVSFQTKEGKFYYESDSVAPATYNAYGEGNIIRVTYLRSNPDWFYLANEVPTDESTAVFTAIFQFGTIASIVLLILIPMYVFWDAGRPGANTPQLKEDSLHPRHGQPRGGFGKRHG